jgi:sugar transferase (PEP-CTERM/EpsH1 system associated)
MRILYLAQRVPYPPNRGDKIATYHQIRHLARAHEVAVVCLADGPEDLANVRGLEPLVTSVDAVPLSRRRGRLRALAALAGRVPLTLSYFAEPELRSRLRARLARERFDAVVIYSSGMAQFVEECAGVPRVMMFCDLDSLKWRQYAEHRSPPLRWVYALEARRLLRYERRVAAAFEHATVCNPRELADCRALLPGARVSCVGNGVDLDYFQPLRHAPQQNGLVFTGVMDYYPNVDGVLWFCREILPRIRQEIPDAALTICGARPTRAVRALARIAGVTVTGAVADVRPVLGRARVGVIPLRLGRGVQNKLLEAMAMGLPTVATTTAHGGVEAARGTDLLVADEPEAFAVSVVRLLRDRGLCRRMGQAARLAVERNYSWETRLAALDAILDAVTAGPGRRPAAAVR